MVKLLLKLIWFGFGTFGLVVIGQKYWPGFKSSDLVKGVQSMLISGENSKLNNQLTVENLQNLDPQTASQVLGQMVKTEAVKILDATTEQVKTFPAKQVRKIKIGACENLLEEDMCSLVKELNCQ